jgi:hypothetical protein
VIILYQLVCLDNFRLYVLTYPEDILTRWELGLRLRNVISSHTWGLEFNDFTLRGLARRQRR